jgi:7-dehydrocholesterol reductase
MAKYLALMCITPPFAIVITHASKYMEGACFELCVSILKNPRILVEIWPSMTDPVAWKLILSFMAFQLFLMKAVPGKTFTATVTPMGNTPVYKANGMACYAITNILLVLCQFNAPLIAQHTGVNFRLALVYDKFPEILSSLNVFSLLFCAMLYVKGWTFPSSTDVASSGDVITDYYWGMELYPRILGWDVKMFTNCRSGMMFWAAGTICFAHKAMEVNDGSLPLGMFVNVALQLIYVTKFFHWEMGYMCSMDIQVDKGGYYLCWGCLVWVPSVYTCHSYYLATNGPELSALVGGTIFVLGALCIWINYDCDHQRYIFRQTNGQCTIWGKKPEYIVAEYSTASGEKKSNLLLLSGWWGWSKHAGYNFEILSAFFWSAPALGSALWCPYFYVIFLTILLVDRSFRDDDRCGKKYGKSWVQYSERVPYKIIPGVI